MHGPLLWWFLHHRVSGYLTYVTLYIYMRKHYIYIYIYIICRVLPQAKVTNIALIYPLKEHNGFLQLTMAGASAWWNIPDS